jgi:hypothetical protein
MRERKRKILQQIFHTDLEHVARNLSTNLNFKITAQISEFAVMSSVCLNDEGPETGCSHPKL